MLRHIKFFYFNFVLHSFVFTFYFLRIWLKRVLGEDSDYYYRVFIKDVLEKAGSKFRPAITKALSDFKPIAEEILKEKKRMQEEKDTHFFEIHQRYDFTEDYEEIPQKLCVLDKLFLLKTYRGKDNELRFLDYIDKKDLIDWWFKNGNQGKEYFAIKYFNTIEKKDSLFYPDWIIRLKNGKIGIFDTKEGDTATDQETKDKAKALAQKLKALGKDFIGGIAVFENGVWYYNDSEKYSYQKGHIGKDSNWKFLENIFK